VYQDIDDPQENSTSLPPMPSRRIKLWIWLVLLVLAGSVIAYVALSSYPKATPPENPTELSETNAYRAAITEASAPLRRARLQDFRSTFASSTRLRAVNAQLSVLNAKESERWSRVTHILFDPESSRLDKLIALDQYEKDWGPSFLGGRDTEIKSLRETLNRDTLAPPSRKLEDSQSPINKTIKDTELAGGPVIRSGPPPRLITPPPVIRPQRANVVVPPKVRRNVKPRYPRRAQRKGIEAVVTLNLSIDKNGRVAVAQLVSVDARDYHKDFVRSAQRAARRTRFFPQTVQGQPQAVNNVRKRYRFALNP